MKEKTKLELIKRYRYLYLNSEIILSGMVSVKNNKEDIKKSLNIFFIS